MNECLMTPQHKKQIGYWVSEKGYKNVLNVSFHETDNKYFIFWFLLSFMKYLPLSIKHPTPHTPHTLPHTPHTPHPTPTPHPQYTSKSA